MTLGDTLALARLGKIADTEHSRYHEDFGQLDCNNIATMSARQSLVTNVEMFTSRTENLVSQVNILRRFDSNILHFHGVCLDKIRKIC